MAEEYWILGPPGTGKTYTLCNQVIPYLCGLYGDNKVMVTSFSRAAAKNIADKSDLKNENMHGTLHSILFNHFHSPAIFELDSRDWNEKYPQWKAPTATKDGGDISGSDIFNRYNYMRNRMIPPSSWPKELLEFDKIYRKYKKENMLTDFTDLIESGLSVEMTPFSPSALVVDEAQDFTPLQLSVIYNWKITLSKLYLCFDDDQTIYNFQGCDIKFLLDRQVPFERKIPLTQSYRVPEIPLRFAEKIVSRISLREDKPYKPTGEKGFVLPGVGNFENPKWLIRKLKEIPGEKMIMTSCGYMLDAIIKGLRQEGIPYHNPYKKTERKWNPLGTKATAMLYAFLSEGEDPPYWSTRQILDWLPHVKVGEKGTIRKQTNEALKILDHELNIGTEGMHTSRNYLDGILAPDAIQPALNRDVGWLKSMLKSDMKKTFALPEAIYKNHGDKETLTKTPDVMLGTIHSFKGTEADTVFLYPDISSSGKMACLKGQEGRDSMHRLFYVGATRTKNGLYLMPASPKSGQNRYVFPDLEQNSCKKKEVLIECN